ncbi:MAG: hypothetical protein ACI8TX_000828 [Hyphomicrobiaceae bacterium]|jgi:hypothetical protein
MFRASRAMPSKQDSYQFDPLGGWLAITHCVPKTSEFCEARAANFPEIPSPLASAVHEFGMAVAEVTTRTTAGQPFAWLNP